jgi:hypothetical protein
MPRKEENIEVALFAWGYHTAALRGEAPREVSTRSIEAWLLTRPKYQRMWKHNHIGTTTVKQLARVMAVKVYRQLSSLGVIVDESEAGAAQLDCAGTR